MQVGVPVLAGGPALVLELELEWALALALVLVSVWAGVDRCD